MRQCAETIGGNVRQNGASHGIGQADVDLFDGEFEGPVVVGKGFNDGIQGMGSGSHCCRWVAVGLSILHYIRIIYKSIFMNNL